MIMATLVAMLAAGVLATLVPSLGASVTVVSSDSGACLVGGGGLDHAAAIQVQWSVTNPDNAHYQLKIYENGTLVDTLVCASTVWNKTVTGLVEAGVPNSGNPGMNANWTYRVDLVRLADGVVIQSETSSAWIKSYRTCTP